MLEIDGVRAALSFSLPYDWELVDGLADRYLEIVDLATAPILTEEACQAIARRKERLSQHNELIMRYLQREDTTPGLEGVVGAYESTLEQVDFIVDNRGDL